ncbi:MAG TPA: hypothetical protein VIA18_29290 [Polyangia bacterium]|nr:hypothetical protein [Polyangia bacterium]
MRARGTSLVGVLLLLFGCAHAPPPHASAPPPPPPKVRTKLAVLPVDADQFPLVAEALNKALHDVKVAGIDDYFLSKVALEVVQLSIECVQASNDCYKAAGKSLQANKLLLAHIIALGKRKRDKTVRVTVTLFDVDAGEPANVVDRIYRTPEAASEGAGDLVAEATSEPPRQFGPEPEPAAASAPANGAAKSPSVARGGKP